MMASGWIKPHRSRLSKLSDGAENNPEATRIHPRQTNLDDAIARQKQAFDAFPNGTEFHFLKDRFSPKGDYVEIKTANGTKDVYERAHKTLPVAQVLLPTVHREGTIVLPRTEPWSDDQFVTGAIQYGRLLLQAVTG